MAKTLKISGHGDLDIKEGQMVTYILALNHKRYPLKGTETTFTLSLTRLYTHMLVEK